MPHRTDPHTHTQTHTHVRMQISNVSAAFAPDDLMPHFLYRKTCTIHCWDL